MQPCLTVLVAVLRGLGLVYLEPLGTDAQCRVPANHELTLAIKPRESPPPGWRTGHPRANLAPDSPGYSNQTPQLCSSTLRREEEHEYRSINIYQDFMSKDLITRHLIKIPLRATPDIDKYSVRLTMETARLSH